MGPAVGMLGRQPWGLSERQEGPCCNPWCLGLYEVTWQKGIKAVDGIKVANQLTVIWEEEPGLPR